MNDAKGYTPPADAIEREARALCALHCEASRYGVGWVNLTSDVRDVYRYEASAMLRERHRRESLIRAEFCVTAGYPCQCEKCRTLRSILTAHAALDRESEPTQDSIVAELVAEWNLNSRAPGIAPLLDKLCALARAKS